VTTKDDSQPVFGVSVTEVTMVVKPAYRNSIQAISVRNKAAVEQTNTPGTWVARVNAIFTVNDLTLSDFVIVKSGDKTPVDITGNWPTPITRITKQDDTQPEFGVAVTEVRIYASGTGTLTGVTVKGKAAVDQGGNVWTVRFNENVDLFSLTAAEVQIAYTPPAPPSATTLITYFNVGYSDIERGYVASLHVTPNEGVNVDTIEIKDANGTVLASFPNGGLERTSVSFRFQGLVEAVPGADATEAKANAQALAGKAVTVMVTASSGDFDTADDTYAWD
jgi:hypothetical protein